MTSKTDNSSVKLNTSKDPFNQTGFSQGGKSRLSTSRKYSENEFLTNQLDPNRIQEYIALLSEFEKTSIEDRNFKDAEIAAQRIEELKAQEVEYKRVMLEEIGQSEYERIEAMKEEQVGELNRIWDLLIEEHIDKMRTIEREMINTHEEEARRFDEEAEKIGLPKPKYSKEYLITQDLLARLIKTRSYTDAEGVSKKLELMEKKENGIWAEQYRDKLNKKKEQLFARQKNELEALQEKLKNSLQEKLRMRAAEERKILQRFQNMKNDLELKKSSDISKLNLANEKMHKSAIFRHSPSKSLNQSFAMTPKFDTSRSIINQSHVGN